MKKQIPLVPLTGFVLAAMLFPGLTPSAQAQSAPTSGSEEQSVDLLNNDGSFSPFDLWHRLQFMRKDPAVFQQEQNESFDSAVSDFRTRQLEQLQLQQGQGQQQASEGLGVQNSVQSNDRATQATQPTTQTTAPTREAADLLPMGDKELEANPSATETTDLLPGEDAELETNSSETGSSDANP
jgi:hypothetical protein